MPTACLRPAAAVRCMTCEADSICSRSVMACSMPTSCSRLGRMDNVGANALACPRSPRFQEEMKMNVMLRCSLAYCVVAAGLLSAEVHAVAPQATPADQLKLLPGFKAELLHTVPADTQGSWVNLALDGKGRLIASHERFQLGEKPGTLFRITPPPLGGDAKDTKVERLNVPIGSAHGLLHAFGSLYVMVNDGNRSGLYRLRDTNDDDQYDYTCIVVSTHTQS